jgi:regulatory protein
VAVVTALRATRRGGVALDVDGVYLCTVSESLVARWGLYRGRELDDEALSEVRTQASNERVMTDAYRLLAHRARGRIELERRLRQKGHDATVVTGALERLTDDGLLDDADFSRRYVADKRDLSGWGSMRIRRSLVELGVAADVADTALAAPAGEEGDGAELGRALRLLRRKGAPQPPLDVARRRAYDALLRRGFAVSVSHAAVKIWCGETSEERT